MVLSGLTFSSWQAWIAGSYFVKVPWGLPSSTGFFFHPYVFFAFVVNTISYGFWTDCQMKIYPILSNFSMTEKFMADAVVYLSALFNFYFRFNFYRKSANLVELLVSLEQPKYTALNSLFRKCWKKHKIVSYILALPRYLVAVTLVCAYSMMTAHYPDAAFFLPRTVYFVLFFLFTAFPSVITIVFAYDLIIITTFHMLWTFEDYCAQLEEHIYKGYFLRRRFSFNATPSIRSLQNPTADSGVSTGESKYDKQICKVVSNEFRNMRRLSDIESGKGFERLGFKCFVERFDWIHGLAEKYNNVIGPLILGVVVRCVFSIVHSVNAILLKSEEKFPLKNWYHVLLLLIELSQLIILKFGSEIHERISFWKSKLTKAWLLTSSGDKGIDGNFLRSTFDSEFDDETEYDNQLVKDLVNYVCTWNWKVSAAGIFDVDKSLMSGIVSTTLTYVIILFQLNLTENRGETRDAISVDESASNTTTRYFL